MGYLSGWDSAKELKAHILRDDATPEYKAIAHATTNVGRNLWVVYEKRDGSGARLLALYLLRSYRGEWGYKSVSESMGPAETDCPLRFLDMVPLDPKAQYAGPWREKVKAHHAKASATFSEGETVRVFGKLYKVLGRVKRSYRIQSLDTGQVFKCGAAKMHAVKAEESSNG